MSNNADVDKWQEENPPSEEGDDEEKEPMMEAEMWSINLYVFKVRVKSKKFL